MRLTVSMFRPGDAGRWHVYLDGERLPHVVEADEEQGYVVAHALRDGRPYLNEEKSAAVTYRRTGHVRIVDTRHDAS